MFTSRVHCLNSRAQFWNDNEVWTSKAEVVFKRGEEGYDLEGFTKEVS
jgi:hypothetical protein